MKTIKRNNGNDIKIYATTLEDVAFDQIKELGEFEQRLIKEFYEKRARKDKALSIGSAREK